MSDFSTADLRSYLQWQSDMGGEEVILEEPWRGSSPNANRTGVSVPAGRTASGRDSEATGVGLLQALAAEFAGSGPVVSQSPKRRLVATPAPVKAGDLPGFATLAAYGEYILTHYHEMATDWSSKSNEPPILGEGSPDAKLLVLFLMPDERAEPGRILAPEDDLLLTRMLSAIGFSRAEVYCTSIAKLKPRPGKLTRRHLVRHWPWLVRELELVPASHILAMGEACAQYVLKTGKNLEELREGPADLFGKACTVTYHPSQLSAQGELKTAAWKDLQGLKRKWEEVWGAQ